MRLRTEQAKAVVDIDGTKIGVQRLTRDRRRELREKHGSGTVDYECAIFCEMVTGWPDTIHDHNGPLPCTEANKRLVYLNDDDFANAVFIGASSKFSGREEAAEKNSEPGASGSSSQEELPAKSVESSD